MALDDGDLADFAEITGEWKLDTKTPIDADTPVEQRFLMQLRDTPEDLAMRMVFADWLEERGYPNKAQVVRLLADPPEEGTPAIRELRRASAHLEGDWLAIVSRAPIDRCDLKLKLKCPLSWDALASTDSPTVRHCGQCNRQVHFCASFIEVRRHGSEGHCVAFSSAMVRNTALEEYDRQEIEMGEIAEPEYELGTTYAGPLDD